MVTKSAIGLGLEALVWATFYRLQPEITELPTLETAL